MAGVGTFIYVIVMLLAGLGLGWYFAKRKLNKQIKKIDEKIKEASTTLKLIKNDQMQSSIKREVRDDGRRRKINGERERRENPRGSSGGESGTESIGGESNNESTTESPSIERTDEGRSGVQNTKSVGDGEVKQSEPRDNIEPEEDEQEFNWSW